MEIKFNIKADTPNVNGIIYPKRIIEKMFEDYSKQDHKYGTLGYRNKYYSIKLDEIVLKL